ncbi:polyphosphate kinase 2 family protein [Herbivorax sp. ANBcel31]|uniref:polyphosphate kinase 2 family protein n=1 Tax=Herbivorax sp. ANBcel31 TaxID=3069754 RepID=UPI0027B1451B|nr:polyphosphate kinase 2 family protein [Herbivorax sp. ANBcel31]MDQ2086162.1 polyphosphate kinase 2 family protein [Herbivorax sp. ANBcel31]
MVDIKSFRFNNPNGFDLSQIDTVFLGDLSKGKALSIMDKNKKKMLEFQNKLYAHSKYSILVIFQAMDTAGKDGAIRHVMTGLNPQGVSVYSFKKPTEEELNHDYLWRHNKTLPERGHIGVFNRSYYEEVLVTRVHNIVKNQMIPEKLIGKDLWQMRYRQIRDYERYLKENGIIPVKFFLHISKDEQKNRLLSRIDKKHKNWKFSESDVEEREFWDDYQFCYREAIANTATKHAPWYIIPSDKKWFARFLISQVMVDIMGELDIDFPEIDEDIEKKLQKYRDILLES